MASFLIKLSTFAFLLLSFTVGTNAACPAFCYCTKQIATRICSMPAFSSKCQVQKCTKATCGKTGYRCQDKSLITPTPLPSPNVVITKPVSIISQAKKVEIQKNLVARGGCNANVCFAIDGSGSIRPQSFQNEKDFVTDVVNIINIFNPRVAATQYTAKSHPIFAMNFNTNAMTQAVKNTKQKRGRTSITAGINYCFGQIKPFLGQPNKVVVLGDGFHNTGGNVKTAANQVWRNGGVISVVAADDPITKINQALLNSLTGNNPVYQFKISAFTDRFRLVQVIEELTYAICAP